MLLLQALLARPSGPRAEVEELARARIVATGDVMLHAPVKSAAAERATEANHGGYDELWAEVAGSIAEADWAFANLEFPVAPATGSRGQPRVFNGPAVVLDSLASAGFDAVALANNHVYDQGRAGLVETVDQVARAGLVQVGAGRSCAEAAEARLVDLPGAPSDAPGLGAPPPVRLAVIGATAVLNQALNRRPSDPCVAELDEERLLDEVARARTRGAEIVTVSLHWGVEYAPAPDSEQVALAERLVAGGVDLILGHHPHVLQPIAWVEAGGRRGLVAYSLGNFVSNQSAWYDPEQHGIVDAAPRLGALLEVDLVRTRHGRGREVEVRTELADPRVVPLWTENDRAAGIRVVPLEPLLDELDAAMFLSAADDEIERLGEELARIEERWDAVAAAVGPEWLPAR